MTSYADLAQKTANSKSRKQWLMKESGTDEIMTESQLAHTATPDSVYEDYLSQLSKRNRLIRHLQQKDAHQIDLERKEQGFSIYVNGANAGIWRNRVFTKRPFTRPIITPKPRTAEERSVSQSEDGFRRQSAPERGRRKIWTQKTVSLYTQDGEVRARAPDDYSDDFDTISEDSLDVENGDGSDYEDVQELYRCMDQLSVDEVAKETSDRAGQPEHLLIALSDIEQLQRSLIAKSSDLRSSRTRQSGCEFSPVSSLADLSDLSDLSDDEVEEDVQISLDVQQTGKAKSPWQPGDMIVLEFAPKPSRNRKLLVHNRSAGDHDGTVTSPQNSRPSPSQNQKQCQPQGYHEATTVSVVNNNSAENLLLGGNVRGRVLGSGKPPVDSRSVRGSRVEAIVEQVLLMDSSQQIRFMKTLQHLTPCNGNGNGNGNCADTADGKVDDSTTSTSYHPTTNDQAGRRGLRVELLNNWGSDDRIGLTEIQLFDAANQRLLVAPSSITVHGADEQQGNIANIVNNKYKSTKERNMWSCRYQRERPVLVVFDLTSCQSGTLGDVTKMRFWNFNKSLQELCVGVKDVRVTYDGTVLYSGSLDKGCANQVFDYSCTATLVHPPARDVVSPASRGVESPVSRGVESPVSRGVDNPKSKRTKKCGQSYEPSSTRSRGAEVPHPFNSMDFDLWQKKRRVSKSRDVVRNSDVCRLLRESRIENNVPPKREEVVALTSLVESNNGSNSPNSTEDPGNVRPQSVNSISSLDFSDNDDSMLQQLHQIRSSSNKKTRPRQSHRACTGDEGRASTKTKLCDDGALLKDWPNRGLPDLVSVLDDDVDDDENGRPRRVHSGRRAKSLTGVSSESVSAELSARAFSAQRRLPAPHLQEKRLEESWSSLNLFNKSQRGRISMEIEDDVLDSYLHPPPQQTRGCSAAKAGQMDTVPWSSDNLELSDDVTFMIPELPRGRTMVVDILTTWGDRHYVGLTGIEIFTKEGPPPIIEKISADPADINVLGEYNSDPRVVTNLVDGVNRTRDDIHMWLAPFTPGQHHTITIALQRPATLAMMRIWNYNKSRIHSYRGAKDVEIRLDKTCIFVGEIARATGGLLENYGETILFTTDEETLERVSQYDQMFDCDEWSDDENEATPNDRPNTADDGHNQVLQRPFTQANPAALPPFQMVDDCIRDSSPESELLPCDASDTGVGMLHQPSAGVGGVYSGRVLQLNFTHTWGDQHYLGLTGLSLVGGDGEDIPLSRDQLTASPADLTSLPGCQSDLRTLDKLVDGVNVTMEDQHMWLVPYTAGGDHLLTIDLRRTTDIIGLRLWNYNKTPDDTYRGAKIVHVMLDDKLVSPMEGYLVRKGPGNCFFDYAQEVIFAQRCSNSTAYTTLCSQMSDVDSTGQDYQCVRMPCGFIYQFHLISTWGDAFYIGLNGLEFYDGAGEKINLVENNVAAYPDSVNVLEGVSGDVRTPNKLINGHNSTDEGCHMWLAPIIPGLVNRLFVIFDQPTTVSMIKLWNYSKTSTRGVRDFGLYVDDLLVYNGTIDQVYTVSRGILPTVQCDQQHHTIAFTNLTALGTRVQRTVIRRKSMEQDVQMTNDRSVVTHYNNFTNSSSNTHIIVDQALRPVTAVSGPAKPQR